MAIRYWALTDPVNKDKVTGVFREVKARRSLVLQYWSRDNKWATSPHLVAYLAGGEPGAEPISAKDAEQYISRWAGRPVDVAEPAAKPVPRLSVPLDKRLRRALLRATVRRTQAAGRFVSMGQVARQILVESLLGDKAKTASEIQTPRRR